MIIERFVEVWLIGCFIAFIILNFCDIVGKDKINSGSFWLGVSFSWIVPFYFALLVFRRYKNIKTQKNKQHFLAKLGDSALVKTTIEKYWVPATKYGEQFDFEPTLPIKDSPLCKVYYTEVNNKIFCL